jgi:hypothetical protein
LTSLDRTLASRHECKYFVAPDALPMLRALSRPFVRPDEYTQRAPTRRYRLASLYLDGPDLPLYRGTFEGHRNRFKVRIRSYGDEPEAPVFCEVKRRVDRIVRKLRVSTDRGLAQRVARAAQGAAVPLAAGNPKLAEFIATARSAGAGPLLRVRYEREAYESNAHDPVRMTFDTNLCFAGPGEGDLFRLGGTGWTPVPLPGAIVEMKFTDRCPSWMTRIIDELHLCRESIPKYVLCVEEADKLGLLQRPLQGLEGYRTA